MFRHQLGDDKVLKIGIGGHWGSLHPGLQHRAIGDLLLGNQFESLILSGQMGEILPSAAKSWSISPDWTSFTFKIDRDRKFSDGSALTSFDFANAWSSALAMDPISANSSLLDVLYNVVGFEDFRTTGKLTGIETPDAETLIIKFKKPFRVGLAQLVGTRFSVFKEINGAPIGTGPYVINPIDENTLSLEPNRYHAGSEELRTILLKAIGPEDSIARLASGEIDVYTFSVSDTLASEMKEHSNLTLIPGEEAIHLSINVNQLPGRLFSDLKLRQALQYLVLNLAKKNPEVFDQYGLCHFDPQIYLPLQKGRLTDARAQEIFERGKDHVTELIDATKKRPLLVYAKSDNDWIFKLLSSAGLTLSEKSKGLEDKDFFAHLYTKSDHDIIRAGFSVVNTDPDGVYHRLGTNGSIVSPYSFNKDIGQMLEEGRNIVDPIEVDSFYKKISEKILTEVPMIHYGYCKMLTIYRNDKVHVEIPVVSRSFGDLTRFRLSKW